MSQAHTFSPSRRAFVGLMVTAGAAGLATQVAARGGSDVSQSDRVPRHFSIERFTSLDRNDVYRVNHASRRGKSITIGDFSPSQSRQILRDAAADWPATRASLLR